ncbi:MAG: aminoacyl-tRNA hydrolase [Anaerolineae bacterium]|nr:aminoacyl-tRNA hydrolase [Anaerolineae bacterium]
MAELYLIVGLGNPGRKYEATRHNVGWHVLDEVARRYDLRFDKTEKKAITASGVIENKRVLLAKPQTFMNLSGEAVRGLVDFYKIDLSHILVIYDDLDLPLGTLRLREGGSAGGQNGIKSVIQHLGTKDFNRVRFGIGRPPGRMGAVDYVLQAFNGDEAILAREVAEKAADAVALWLREGIEMTMSRYNGDIQDISKPEPKKHPEEELTILQRAQELAPQDPQPAQKLATLYKRLRQPEEAAFWHQRAGDLYEHTGKLQEAIGQWERAVKLQPSLNALRQRIAAAYEASGNTKKAVLAYLALAENQDSAEDALKAVDAALSINPQHPRALELKRSMIPKTE